MFGQATKLPFKADSENMEVEPAHARALSRHAEVHGVEHVNHDALKPQIAYLGTLHWWGATTRLELFNL